MTSYHNNCLFPANAILLVYQCNQDNFYLFLSLSLSISLSLSLSLSPKFALSISPPLGVSLSLYLSLSLSASPLTFYREIPQAEPSTNSCIISPCRRIAQSPRLVKYARTGRHYRNDIPFQAVHPRAGSQKATEKQPIIAFYFGKDL